MTASKAKSSTWLKAGGLLMAAAALLVLAKVLPLREYIMWLLDALEGFGPAGLAILAVAYVFACIFFIPGSLLTLGAGFLAAALWPDSLGKAIFFGTVTVSAGSVAGATAAFLLGRTLLRGWVASKVRDNPKFNAVDEAVGKNGLKMVFLLRLSPAFPFNVLNYALGVTKVRLVDYVLASWIGMLPGTVLYVYLGTAGGGLLASAAGGSEKTIWEWVLMGVGLAATLAVVVLVTVTAKRALAESVGAAE